MKILRKKQIKILQKYPLKTGDRIEVCVGEHCLKGSRCNEMLNKQSIPFIACYCAQTPVMQFPALLALVLLSAPALTKDQAWKDDHLIYAGMLMSADMAESSGNGQILPDKPEGGPEIIEKPKVQQPPKPQRPAMPGGMCPFACQCSLRVVQCSDLGM